MAARIDMIVISKLAATDLKLAEKARAREE
jgi:hypothetical protein